MTTNRDWLFSLPLEEQYAWMNAEHQDGTLDGDTAALNARIAELTAKLERCQNRLGFYRSKLGTCADLSEEIRKVAMGITDEGMA